MRLTLTEKQEQNPGIRKRLNAKKSIIDKALSYIVAAAEAREIDPND